MRRRPPTHVLLHARALVALLLSHAVSRAAAAQLPVGPVPTVRLVVDNDLLAVRGRGAPPDYDYTHGTRIGIAWPGAPARVARLLRAASRCDTAAAGSACVVSGLAVAQEIYTPRRVADVPIAGERPHAAWLNAGAHVGRVDRTGMQALALRAGVTGPPALGEQVQNGVHRLLGNRLEEGWPHQLPARLVVAADYGATRVLLGPGSSAAPSRFLDASAGVTVGTMRRAVQAGAAAHYGRGAPRSALADAPLVARPGRLQLQVAYRQELVLADGFVEGIGATAGASRVPWVNEASVRAGWRWSRLGLEYRYVSRGREYRAQPGRHAYGTLAMTGAF